MKTKKRTSKYIIENYFNTGNDKKVLRNPYTMIFLLMSIYIIFSILNGMYKINVLTESIESEKRALSETKSNYIYEYKSISVKSDDIKQILINSESCDINKLYIDQNTLVVKGNCSSTDQIENFRKKKIMHGSQVDKIERDGHAYYFEISK